MREFDVVIADDDRSVCQALAGLIEDFPGLRLSAMADSGAAAAILCAELRPDLAVVDVVMPSGGTVAVAAIHVASPNTLVVAYTARADRLTRERLLESGARAVFIKGAVVDLGAALFGLVSAAADDHATPPLSACD